MTSPPRSPRSPATFARIVLAAAGLAHAPPALGQAADAGPQVTVVRESSEPTRITFSGKGMPAREAIAEVARQAGARLVVDDERQRQPDLWPPLGVHTELAGVPYWLALDRVCADAGFCPAFSRIDTKVDLTLTPNCWSGSAYETAGVPVVTDGAVVAYVNGFADRAVVDAAGGRRRTISLFFRVMVEPKFLPLPEPVRCVILSAVDEHGRQLARPDKPEFAGTADDGGAPTDPVRGMRASAELVAPAGEVGRVIKSIRGEFKLLIPGGRTRVSVAGLDNARHATAQLPEGLVVVSPVSRHGDRTDVTVTVFRGERGAAEFGAVRALMRRTPARLVDAAGRSWEQERGRAGDAPAVDKLEMQYTFVRPARGGPVGAPHTFDFAVPAGEAWLTVPFEVVDLQLK